MTDTVLQSFCERCGTRYTFTEQETRRESGLSKLGRSLGLRSAPRPSGEPTVATALPTHDPFRATFHFCLECRQYTCQSCWNADAGYCQTCYPLPEIDLRAAEREASAEAKSAGPAAFAAGTATAPGGAWPTTDLDRARQAPLTPAPDRAPHVEDGPSPWGPAIDTEAVPATSDGPPMASTTDDESRPTDVPEEHTAGEFVDPWSGRESIAGAMLRAAGAPSSPELATPVADGPTADPTTEEGAHGPDGVEQPDAAVDADVPPQDPWRGVVYSYDELEGSPAPASAAEQEDATPPQPDPDLPWLAVAATAETVEAVGPAVGPVGPPATDAAQDDVEAEPADPAADEARPETEAEHDVDHRGWIAASMVAAGTGWSAQTRGPELDRDIAIVDVDEEARPATAAVVWMSEPDTDDEAAGDDEATTDEASVRDEADAAAGEDREPATATVEADDEPAWPSSDTATGSVPWPSVDTKPAAPVADVSAGDERAREDEGPDIGPAIAFGFAAATARDDEVEAATPDAAALEAERPEGQTPADPFARPAPSVAPPAEPPAGPAALPLAPLAPIAPLGPPPAPPGTPPIPPGPPPPLTMPTYASAQAPATPLPPAAPPPFAVAPTAPLAPPPPAGPSAAPIQSPAPMPFGTTAAATHVLRPADHPLPPQAAPPPPPLIAAVQPPAYNPPPPAFVAPTPPLGVPAAPAAAAVGAGGQADRSSTKARPCHSCSLPLSAKARFCRRCGAQQAA